MIQAVIDFLDDEEKALYEAIEADDYEPGKSQLTESEKDRLQSIASATLNETWNCFKCTILHKDKSMGMTSVSMPDELLDRLDHTAEQLRRTKGWIIKDAVEEYVVREELKQRRNQETLDSWKDYEAGRVIDSNTMMAWLESWGTENEKEPHFK